MKPRVYNRDMELVGILQNASRIGYRRVYNNLHTAFFELPADDPKNALCDTYYIVDIFDGDVSTGKYRVLDEPESDITSDGAFVQYSLEHVIAFLLNDFIDGYFETGGTDDPTTAVINQLLAKQSVQRWKLGECDFNYQFQYSWENVNVMEALFSIPTCFDVKYHWVYDTSTYPWTISLKAQSTERSCEIRRKRNMQYIKRGKDSSALCTRLYCKGSGEGVNQLGISEVNPTGKPYIDADTIGSPYNYGILCLPFIDKSITDASLLYARGLSVLEEVKHPRYTYTGKAVDFSKISGISWDEYDEGKCVHLIDEEKNLDVDAIIIEVAKSDVDGNPLDMDVVISNKSSDIASTIEEIAHKTAITAQYSQGATNLYAQQFTDNADGDHPAVMRVYIPTGCKQINQVLLSCRMSAFRAYETGAAAGGGSTTTSSDGGGSERTSSADGEMTITKPQMVYAASVVMTGPIDKNGDDIALTDRNFLDQGTKTDACTDRTGASGYLVTNENGIATTSSAGGGTTGASDDTNHSHGCGQEPNHKHSVNGSSTSYNGSHRHNVFNATCSHAHPVDAHTHTVGAHSHLVTSHSHTLNDHIHSIPAHQHGMSHKHGLSVGITIPAMTINVPAHMHMVSIDAHSHDVTLEDHTHDIVYGIYTGSTAQSVTVKVDNNAVPATVLKSSELDIVAYLAKDSNGKITRGTWHTIELVPDSLTRIEANLFVQTFVTSYSGGNY